MLLEILFGPYNGHLGPIFFFICFGLAHWGHITLTLLIYYPLTSSSANTYCRLPLTCPLLHLLFFHFQVHLRWPSTWNHLAVGNFIWVCRKLYIFLASTLFYVFVSKLILLSLMLFSKILFLFNIYLLSISLLCSWNFSLFFLTKYAKFQIY